MLVLTLLSNAFKLNYLSLLVRPLWFAMALVVPAFEPSSIQLGVGVTKSFQTTVETAVETSRNLDDAFHESIGTFGLDQSLVCFLLFK